MPGPLSVANRSKWVGWQAATTLWHPATRRARSGRGTEHPAQDHSEDIYDATTTLYG